MSDEHASVFDDVKVPFPDAAYATRATTRLAHALVPGTGIGSLSPAVAWAGRVQATEAPGPFASVTALVVSGKHSGDFAYGDSDAGSDELVVRLAERAGANVHRVDAGEGAAAEHGPVLSDSEYVDALEIGRQAADACIDSGADLIVLCGLGPGTRAAAVAVASHLTRTPAVELSPRVRMPGGVIDDNIWMRRVAAIRDAFARLRGPGREAKAMLSELGGPVMATLTGAIVGAALRRTPMLIDGPVAAAAALVARDFSLGAPKWCYAPDRMPHPVVAEAADQIGLAEPLGFGVDLGEGCAALHALPLLQQTLTTVAELSYLAPSEADDDDEEDEADEDDLEPDDGDAT